MAVPGRPGPLVWGDMESRLEELQTAFQAGGASKLSVTSREP
jgi:hypothetical protein